MPKYLGNVRYWVNSGKHVLALSFSVFDPKRSSEPVGVRGGSSARLRSRARPGSNETYFVNICLTGFATVGSAGEIANVSHVLQPGARLAASKSP